MPNRIMVARMEHELDLNLKQCRNVNLPPCGVGWSVCGVDLAPGQGQASGRSNKNVWLHIHVGLSLEHVNITSVKWQMILGEQHRAVGPVLCPPCCSRGPL
jgi:hypothetical protein